MNGICGCDRLFVYNSETEACEQISCFYGCSDCVNTTVFGCYACSDGFVMVLGVCIKIPTGYNNSTGVYATNGSGVFSVVLTGISAVIYDSISSVPIISGYSGTIYPSLDPSNPIPAYLRGYYFTGTSLMNMPEYGNYKSPALILAPT
jgi:hypothetical protein